MSHPREKPQKTTMNSPKDGGQLVVWPPDGHQGSSETNRTDDLDCCGQCIDGSPGCQGACERGYVLREKILR